MSFGDWETVTNKKGSKNPKSFSKGVKKPSLENMPRIQTLGPVQESRTIYQAFLEEELRKERKLHEAEKGNNSKEVKKPNASQLHKKKDKRMTLKDSITNLDLDEVEEILKRDEASFPKNPEIWLKDLASVLNSKLDHIIDSDPVLADKPLDYPLCLMDNTMRNFFVKKLKGFSAQVYEALMDYCIELMMTAISKDQSSIGYRLTIQLLLQEHADVILNNLSKYESLIQKNTSRPLKCLCILWSVAQVGNLNLSHGIKIWFALMFGLIKVKNLNNYVLSYLENLFERYPRLEDGYKAMSKTDYFKYFGELYSELSTLPGDIRKRLQLLYPNVKAVAWGNVSNNLNIFFIGYLSRLTSDCQEVKKTELLQCLVACLEKDIQSFVHWRKEYHKHLYQSCLLLQHLEANFEKLQLNRNLVFETVGAFQSINEDLSEKLPSKQSPLKSCHATCKVLLLRTSKKSTSRKPYILVLMLVVATLVSGDIYAHGSFNGSLGGQCLSHIMANPYVNDFVQWCTPILGWISQNMKVGSDKVHEIIKPHLNNPKLLEFVSNARQQIQETFDVFSDKLVKHIPELLKYLEIVSDFSLSVLATVSTKSLEVYNSIHNYTLEHVLVGKLSPEYVSKEMTQLVVILQDRLSNLYLKIQGQ